MDQDPKVSPFRVILSRNYRPAFIVLLCILAGNLGYYFLRAQWPIGQPAFKDVGILDNERYLNIMTVTYVCNIIGKFMGGWLIDASNRPTFVFIIFTFLAAGATFVTTLFPSFVLLIIFWPLCRLFTTIGKMAVIKMLANYWPSAVMGTVIGISTVSCNFGESISKAVLSLALGVFEAQSKEDGWKRMFYLTMGLSIACILPACLFVRDGRRKPSNDPAAAGHAIARDTQQDPFAHAALEKPACGKAAGPGDEISGTAAQKNLSITDGDVESLSANSEDGTTQGSQQRLGTPAKKKLPLLSTTVRLLRNPRMLLLCLLMMVISCMREVFGAHSVSFMKDVLQLSNSFNGALTSVFCACSAVGALIGGRLIDSVPRRHRSAVNVVYMSAVAVCFLLVALATIKGAPVIAFSSVGEQAMFCVSLIMVGELLFGAPVSYVDGIYLVDLVGTEEISFASGIVGCVGYLGPLLQNEFFKMWMKQGDESRWHLVYFWGMACALISVAISCIYWKIDLDRCQKEEEEKP